MRLLHTMLRVGDLERSLRFYTEVLGMRLLRRRDYPEGRFTLAFVGYGEERDTAVLELTHNWDTSAYEIGSGYGHIAIGVADIHATCQAIGERGGRVVRPPGPMKHGSTVIAFVEDPDGYRVELIQASQPQQGQAPVAEPSSIPAAAPAAAATSGAS
ncbi:MAG: lactoylglutathione lyase [Cyanobium sp.]